MKQFLYLFLLLIPSFAFASGDGSTELWFMVFLVASFLLSGTMYLLGTLVFVALMKDAERYQKLAIIIPSIVMAFTFVMAFSFMNTMPITIGAYLLGWGLSYLLHHWGVKMWQKRVMKNT